MADSELTDDVRQQILNALVAGRKIEAIKLYRAATGKGLKEAKDFIDLLAKEMGERDPELLNNCRHPTFGRAPNPAVYRTSHVISLANYGR